MSVVLQNPRIFQNRNRIISKTQEMIRGSHRAQQRELVAQQNLILLEQQRRVRLRREANGASKMNGVKMNGVHDQSDLDQLVPNGILQNGFTHDDFRDNHDTHSNPEDRPTSNATAQPTAQATIFVSVASYRDRECILTVADLFAKAEHFNRVFVGVYEQNDPETDKPFTIAHLLENEPDKIPKLAEYYNANQLRVMSSDCTDAKGPMYARALIEQNLFENEQFYMMIDSHSLFEPKWDSICLSEWNKARKLSPRPVLSYYPPNFVMNSQGESQRTKTPLQLNPGLKLDYMRLDKFDKNCGFPVMTKQAYVNMPREPIRSLFWTACFSFAPASVLEYVPFDDGFPYLFLGEEICMNLRLFTHGYDVFGPTQHILYHIETRSYRPTFWELFYVHTQPKDASFKVTDADRDTRKAIMNASIARMSQLLYNHPEHGIPDRYGLGHVRTYEQFCDFIGINFEKQQAEQHTHLGRTRQPSKEEQYAKTVKNTAVPMMMQTPKQQTQMRQSQVPQGTRTQQKQQLMRKTGFQGQRTPQMTQTTRMQVPQMNQTQQRMPRMQQAAVMNGLKPMPMQKAQQTRMTKLTGLTGAGVPEQTAPKQIPRTRTQQFGRPQPQAYVPGMWGKA